MRRFVDLLFAVLGLIFLSPILVLIMILIRIDSRGPIFYTPQMIGRDGQVFPLLRFRTLSKKGWTRIGKFLRAYSLDHLPMLINLLKGDLTLVGPRPMEFNVVDMQDSIWQQYFQVKPGLINYAVLKLGRTWTPSRTSHPQRNQELELEYLRKRSTKSDVQLFLRSLHALVKSKGNIKERGKPDAEELEKPQKSSS